MTECEEQLGWNVSELLNQMNWTLLQPKSQSSSCESPLSCSTCDQTGFHRVPVELSPVASGSSAVTRGHDPGRRQSAVGPLAPVLTKLTVWTLVMLPSGTRFFLYLFSMLMCNCEAKWICCVASDEGWQVIYRYYDRCSDVTGTTCLLLIWNAGMYSPIQTSPWTVFFPRWIASNNAFLCTARPLLLLSFQVFCIQIKSRWDWTDFHLHTATCVSVCQITNLDLVHLCFLGTTCKSGWTLC